MMPKSPIFKYLIIAGCLAVAVAFMIFGGQSQSKNAELIEAIEKDEPREVERFLGLGANVNVTGRNGFSALMIACAYMEARGQIGNPEIVKILLDAGADVNATNMRKWSALMIASGYAGGGEDNADAVPEFYVPGNAEIVKMLLDRGADPNAKSQDGWTALLWSGRTGQLTGSARQRCVEVQELLVRAGANVNALAPGPKFTPLDFAIHRCLTDDQCDASLIRLIMEKGGDAPSWSANEKLAIAAVAGPLEFLNKFLQAGAKPNAKVGTREATPLMYAARQGHLDVVKALLEKGADVNARDRQQQTALALAKKAGHKEIATLLMEAGGQE